MKGRPEGNSNLFPTIVIERMLRLLITELICERQLEHVTAKIYVEVDWSIVLV